MGVKGSSNLLTGSKHKQRKEMNAIDILLDKGSVQLNGLVKDRIIPVIYDVVKENLDWLIGAYIFETRKEDGFHSDSTSVYIVEEGAIFRPICNEKYGKAAAVYVTDANRALFRSLRTLGVCPMRESEYQELKAMGLIA